MAKKTQVKKAEAESTQADDQLPLDGTKGASYIQEQGGVSKAIRSLVAKGLKYGEVAKMLNKRYQHVRNVMITPVGKKAQEQNKDNNQ
jgi:hypothetical protein